MRYADRVEGDELRSVIDQEIDRLAESHRLPVVLCCLEGISHEEAAQRLRWPLGTVKSRLARGRKRLQERLVRRGFCAVGGNRGRRNWSARRRSIGRGAARLDRCHREGRRGSCDRRDITRRVGPGAAVGPGSKGGGLDDRHQAEAGCRHPPRHGGVNCIGGIRPDRAAAQKADVAPVIAIAIPSRHQTKGAAEPTNLAAKLSAAGTVVDEAGRPIAAARVILASGPNTESGEWLPKNWRSSHEARRKSVTP